MVSMKRQFLDQPRILFAFIISYQFQKLTALCVKVCGNGLYKIKIIHLQDFIRMSTLYDMRSGLHLHI